MLAVLLMASVGSVPPARTEPAIGGLFSLAVTAAAPRAGGGVWQPGSVAKPYAKLFAPQSPLPRGTDTPRRTRELPPPSKTVVICGMRVFQVDIPYPPPKSMGIRVVEDPTRFTIGRVPAPACHPEPRR